MANTTLSAMLSAKEDPRATVHLTLARAPSPSPPPLNPRPRHLYLLQDSPLTYTHYLPPPSQVAFKSADVQGKAIILAAGDEVGFVNSSPATYTYYYLLLTTTYD